MQEQHDYSGWASCLGGCGEGCRTSISSRNVSIPTETSSPTETSRCKGSHGAENNLRASGLRRFTDAKGLYILDKAADRVTPDEGHIQFRAFTDETELVGGRFSLWRFPFVMSISPDPIGAVDQ